MERTENKVKNESAPDFGCLTTFSRLNSEVLPLLAKIASDEFRSHVMGNPDIDDEDEADMETCLNMMEAILVGFLRGQKDMYLNYGKQVSTLLYTDSKKDLDRAINALCQK